MRLSHLGDVVHALPLLHALRAEHPRAEIAWAVQPEFAGVLEALREPPLAIRFERRGGASAWPALRAELARFGADWAIDAQGNLKSAIVTLCSGAARRSGWSAGDWTERIGAHVLNDPAPPIEPGGLHAVERVLHLARHLAPQGARALPEPLLSPPESALADGRALLADLLGRDPRRPAWILHLGAPGDLRSWPSEHFELVARALAREGARVLLLSGPAEELAGAELERQLAGEPGLRHWVGQRGLARLAAFLRAAAERGARMLACDSGPLHLAAACGLEVVALCGPQDARLTGPWPLAHESGPHRALTAEPAPACAPCLARRCSHPQGPVCMSGLAPERVLRELRRIAACA